jgi:endogenous inhibitor of DNA gyrase (YacG/DUF329 family)
MHGGQVHWAKAQISAADGNPLAARAAPPYIAAMSASTSSREEARCVICGKPRAERYAPFCSKRCADIDLHRWLVGAYAVPATEDEPEDGSDTGDGRGAEDAGEA